MSDIKHTYSFTAVFEDGTIIEHDCNGDDFSVMEGAQRIKPNGTSFTDVSYKSGTLDVTEEQKELAEEMKAQSSKLISFVLHNDEFSWGVDLTDGHFEINGVPFWQHRPDLNPYKDFRVMYWRTVVREIHQETTEVTGGQAIGYTLGWQVTHNGENVQRFIVIEP